MARTRIPRWALYVVAGLVLLGVAYSLMGTSVVPMCPGTQVYCPGVGCMSGQDKCMVAGAGGATRVFSHETFVSAPMRAVKEAFTPNKTCPDGTRSNGACLLDFPTF